MGTAISSPRRAPRPVPQDGPAVQDVVNLEARSPVVRRRRRRRGGSAAAAACTSPIDAEALEDQVQAVAPLPVPLRRRNQRNRRQSVTVVDQEVDASQEGNKRQRVVPVVIGLSSDSEDGSSFKSNKEHAMVAPKEPSFNCPVCWGKLEEPCTTICGHIFCAKCIEQAIQVRKSCPNCRRRLRKNNYHRIYLPEAGA
ncbi:hypothetical protein ACP70R_032458 [Stipagrostis hirtigluma subsp. patula]